MLSSISTKLSSTGFSFLQIRFTLKITYIRIMHALSQINIISSNLIIFNQIYINERLKVLTCWSHSSLIYLSSSLNSNSMRFRKTFQLFSIVFAHTMHLRTLVLLLLYSYMHNNLDK